MGKVWGIRCGLIGDTIMSLPILEYIHELYPEFYKIFVLEQKCKQASFLYHQHHIINKLLITNYSDGLLTEEEKHIKDSCDIIFNIAPQHPLEQDWYNYRNCLQETALMAGINPEKIKNKKPILFRWFEYDKLEDTISIFPFAGYNSWHSRNPTVEWWKKAIVDIIKLGYKVNHFGYVTEPILSDHINYKKFTNLSLFEQIKIAYGSKLNIGTDSGSMWIIGAYGLPQINLLTNHMNSHTKNFLALAPENHKDLVINLFAENGCNNIKVEDLIKSIKTFIND